MGERSTTDPQRFGVGNLVESLLLASPFSFDFQSRGPAPVLPVPGRLRNVSLASVARSLGPYMALRVRRNHTS
jgi:hypothetical protein